MNVREWLGSLACGCVMLFSVGVDIRPAAAHCDTMDGPVVKDARDALSAGQVAPVLKWVRAADEMEIREAFKKTLAVRAKGEDVRELADRFFFETLVRVHRAGEGAPFTGLKAAGEEVEPGIAVADQALEHGSVEPLIKLITDEVARGIRGRFAKAEAARKQKDVSVTAGREFVEAYVVFIHYVEGLHALVAGPGHPHSATSASAGHESPAEHKHAGEAGGHEPLREKAGHSPASESDGKHE